MKININKNDAGYFRIPFHDRGHMQTILDRLGLKKSEYAGDGWCKIKSFNIKYRLIKSRGSCNGQYKSQTPIEW